MKKDFKKLLEELELVVVDIRRSARDLEETITSIKSAHVEEDDARCELILFAIDKRIDELSKSYSLEKREKEKLKQLKKSLRSES